ncbi:AMP-binding protein, partial [Burkholderia cenocepacia]
MNALISIADLLEHGAERWPHHPAYADGGGTLTYDQLARAVRRAAAVLAARGVQPGERVAIYAPKRVETVVAMLAANALGAIFVPVNPQLKEAQIEHIVADSGAALFVTGAQRLKRLPALAALVGTRTLLIEELADAIDSPGTDTP